MILVVATVTRLLAFWSFVSHHPRGWFLSHPYEMGLLASSLIHGLGYSSPFGGTTGPTAFIAPGYPTLVAGVFLMFGAETFASAVAMMLLQVLVSVITIWLMMRVAEEVLDARTAVIAGTFWAIAPPVLFIPVIFWESSFSACLFVAMIALAIRCRRTPTTSCWILMGASCAITGLINPAMLPTLVAMMGWIAYQTRRAGWKAPALGVVTLLLVFSPWPIRNAVRFHAFIPMRSTVGYELWMGNRPGSNGRLDEKLFPAFDMQELTSYLTKGEVAYTSDKSKEAWAYIRAQPGIFVNVTARRIFRFWSGTGNLDGPLLYEIHALLTTILGIAGLLLLYRTRMRWLAVLMTFPLLLFPLPYYITHAEFRYRLNIDPLLTMLAAYAVTQFFAARAKRRSPNHSA
jgi:hypothetical protein